MRSEGLIDNKDHFKKIVNRKSIAKNTLWNLLGQMIPALVAVVSVPLVVHKLGTDRFGVLTLAWTVIGYFSLFDFGLGRAVTQLVARKLGKNEGKDLPALIWTALALLGGFGLMGAIAAASLSPFFIHRFLHIPPELQHETLICFYIMSATIPVIAGANVLNGLLEANQQFNRINFIRIPLGVANFLFPLLIIPFTQKTYWLVALLAGTRTFGLLFYFKNCLQLFPDFWQECQIQWGIAKTLLGFGGWMTVSNVISPLMVTMDRFLIGAILTISAVAYYATPFELAAKLNLMAVPLVRVLFPAFSASHQNDKKHTMDLLKESTKLLYAFLFPVVLVLVIFSKEILGLWLGPDFAVHSQRVLQLLSIGLLINILAQLLFAYIQGIGRPDLTAKNHLLEFPIYLCVLLLMVRWFGIEGAAGAWLLRATLDGGLLYWQTCLRTMEKKTFFNGRSLWMISSAGILSLFVFFPLPLAYRVLAFLILGLGFIFSTWVYYFRHRDRELLLKGINWLYPWIKPLFKYGINAR